MLKLVKFGYQYMMSDQIQMSYQHCMLNKTYNQKDL